MDSTVKKVCSQQPLIELGRDRENAQFCLSDVVLVLAAQQISHKFNWEILTIRGLSRGETGPLKWLMK